MTSTNDNSSTREQRFQDALAACVEALQSGTGDRAALLARYPEFAAELADFFADRDRIDRWAVPPTPTREIPTLGPSEVKTDSTLGSVRYFGDYELLEEVARGGMGVVYKARQVSAKRLVAVKLILAGQLSSAEDVRRFRSEAEAAANLDHPHIVPIFEVGEYNGQQYYSMKLVEGGSLCQHIGRLQQAPREAASLLATVARAVHYAHQRGIIHRDLKPANILIDAHAQPHVVDFGLAKRVEGDPNLTQSGAIVGTASYMAPEQAERRGRRVGPAADVYALGAILYECLTGRPPFQATTNLETIFQVVNKDAVPPSQLQPKTPRDLETICLKCLRKEPEQRYDSAAVLAEDLRRWQAGEPIAARPVGRGERAAKWVKRNPVVAALVAAVVLAVLAGASGTFVKYLDAKEQEGIAKEKAGLATQQEGIAWGKTKELERALDEVRELSSLKDKAVTKLQEEQRQAQYQLAISNVLLAQTAWLDNNPALARERLAAVPLQLRRWEWHYLTRQYQGGIFTLIDHAGPVHSVAFSPDGKRLATASQDVTVRLWDARTGQFLLELKGHTQQVMSVAFSLDGTGLATGSWDQTARLWDAQTGQFLLEFKGHSGAIAGVAFSPDGTRLATGCWDATARLWDTRTGKELQRCNHTSQVESVAFSPDGTRLATGGRFDNSARLWDARTGQFLLECKGHASGVMSVAFNPDGTQLATASYDRTARQWDARTGQFLRECKGHTTVVASVAFSPDGTWLATGSWDGTARLWDARTGQSLLVYRGHNGGVDCVAFSPDGTRLATVAGRETRLWDARSGQPILECKGHSVAFSPDGKLLATADGLARLWDARTGQQLKEFKGARASSVAFSPDGTQLATASGDTTPRLWDRQTGQQLRVFKGHKGFVWSVAFSPDGKCFATAGQDGTARVWDVRTGQSLAVCKGHTTLVLSVAFSPDGKRLATGSQDGTARLWDARTGEELQVFQPYGVVSAVAFSLDGSRLATTNGNAAHLWDVQTGQQLVLCKGHTGNVTGVAFSPDGTRLATASYDETARLWDARTGQQLLVFDHVGIVSSVVFSPNGRRLATATNNGTVRLWEAGPARLPQNEELEYRLWATRPEPDWHEEQFNQFQSNNRFAAAFHLERLLAYRPSQRPDLLRQRTEYLEETLKQNKEDAVGRLLLARTAWHSPTLARKDASELLPSADEKGLLARRTRAGLLLRQQKAAEAVEVLEAALKDRSDDQPPVEELLLAWGYLETKQTDKAKDLWAKATAWLDRGQEAVRATNLVGTLPDIAPLFVAPTHPRYNSFDWETWYEIDVLRHELAPRFEAKKP